MFVILLRFSGNKARAGAFMDGHKAWLSRGFDDGIFLMSGSLQPNAGGAILAHNTTMDELRTRVGEDPFVAENVVNAEVFEITPSRAGRQLDFLLT
jgi:uncharacterized protein YciI